MLEFMAYVFKPDKTETEVKKMTDKKDGYVIVCLEQGVVRGIKLF